MECKVFLAPGLDELGPACDDGDAAPGDMGIKGSHVEGIID